MRSPKRSTSILLAGAAALLAGCGGSRTVTVTHTAPAPSITSASSALAPTAQLRAVTLSGAGCGVPAGEGFMGACAARPAQVFPNGQRFPLTSAIVPGCKIPDVSSWQGAVNWSAVAGWQRQHGCRPAGIFKMGEFAADPFAARNAAETRRLGMWRAGYWFLRATGCGHEAAQIIAAAHALGLTIVFLDDEVPEARGYDGCLAPPLRRAGLIVGEYASPGAYPGGARSSNPAWIAAYGPSSPPAAPWGGRVVAFQCTDGVFGCVTEITGLGRVDVSVDLGVTKLGAPARLVCFGAGGHNRKPACVAIRRRVASQERAAASSSRAYRARGCPAILQRYHWFARHQGGRRAAFRRGALAASRRAFSRQECQKFGVRVVYFSHAAQALRKAHT